MKTFTGNVLSLWMLVYCHTDLDLTTTLNFGALSLPLLQFEHNTDNMW